MFFCDSTLAGSTPPRTTRTDDRSYDQRSTAVARVARSSVDRKDVLKAALQAIRVHVIVDARSAQVDRALQYVDDRMVQSVNRRFRQRLGRAAGTDPGLPERLACIDVADARDASLIEEECLDRRCPPRQHTQKPLLCKV